MPRALAINVAANTTLPGFRAPVYADGRFAYVPIPEREPTRPEARVPTYGDLAFRVPVSIPPDLTDRRVHLDPAFAGHHGASRYTYGDEHGVKAGPIADLAAGDYLLFYATLDARPGVPSGADPDDLAADESADHRPDWMAPEWGAYLIGGFELAADPVTGDQYRTLPAAERERFAGNAHVKRREFDARVLVRGDPGGSALFDVAVPLSSRDAGSDPNRIVTDLSADSGRGPWWRRPLRFDPAATATLRSILARGEPSAAFDDWSITEE